MISHRPTTTERTSMSIMGIPMIPDTVTILTPITAITVARSCSDSAVADILSMNTDAFSMNTEVRISKDLMDHLSTEGLGMGMDHLDMGRSHLAEAAIWAAATWEAATWEAAATGEAATDRSCEHVEQSGLIGKEI